MTIIGVVLWRFSVSATTWVEANAGFLLNVLYSPKGYISSSLGKFLSIFYTRYQSKCTDGMKKEKKTDEGEKPSMNKRINIDLILLLCIHMTRVYKKKIRIQSSRLFLNEWEGWSRLDSSFTCQYRFTSMY